jgi:hypothetical protein
MTGAGAAVLVLGLASASPAAPVGTAFTYQGRLRDGGSQADGNYDFRFIVYGAPVGGSQVGPILTRDDVAVAAGVFTVALDFGAVFDGNARFLETAVRPGSSSGAYAVVSPRQELTPSANAVFSAITGDPTVQRRTVAPTCPPGQYLRALAADGTPTCAADVDTNSGGTVTSLTAGSGLTGGTITSSGTIAVNFGGTGLAATAARGDHDHDLAYQARITGACDPGFTLRHVNDDGTVECEASGVSAPTLTALDTAGDVGQYTSVTIGADGLGLISYYDVTNGDFKVAHCADTACTSATVNTLDTAGGVGLHTSATIGTDGLGLISYRDFTNTDVKVAHCHDLACGTATLTTLDSALDVGRNTSVTIGTDGLGLITYYDVTNADLKVAHCSNTACTAATLATLDGPAAVGRENSAVTIGADGLGLISYLDETNGNLKVAHCNDVACATATLSSPDTPGTVGFNTSVAIGVDGLALISYYDVTNVDLKVAHCNDLACNTATAYTIDTAGSSGFGSATALTIGADGLGLIAYTDGGSGDLKVAHCDNLACSTATLSTLDSAGIVGQYISAAIGADGLALISYYDVTNGDLKVAHCGNVLCNPFVARKR